MWEKINKPINLTDKQKNITKRVLQVFWFLIYPIILYIILEYMKYGGGENFHAKMYFTFCDNGIQFLGIIYLIFLGVMLITRGAFKRSFTSNLICTIIFTIISIVSYYKYSALSMPFVPQDLTLIGNVGQIANFGITEVPTSIIIAVILLIIIIVLNFFIERKLELQPFHIAVRIIMIIVGCIIIYITCIIESRYVNFHIKNDDDANYIVLGANAGFFLRIGDFWQHEPENYNEENINKIREKYKILEGQQKEKPNVIFIMNESYSDPTKLKNVTFTKSLMEGIDTLENVKRGEILSPVLGGGTVFPEFETLTGLTTYFMDLQIYPYTSYINSNMNSIVSLFAQQGYITTGIHPYLKSFYNRIGAYEKLGFKNTVFDAEIEDAEYKGQYISDNEVKKQIIKQFNSSNEKQFIFAVTMQNHMRYNIKNYENYDLDVISEVLTDEELLDLKNYAQGVYDGTQMYRNIAEVLKQSSKPTVLIMFGDHLPLLGTKSSVHYKNGFEANSEEMYKTPYIVWANYDISDVELPELMSAGNLGLHVLKLANIELPWYLKVFEDLYKKEPALNKKFREVSGELIDNAEIVQFDLLHKKQYIEVWK